MMTKKEKKRVPELRFVGFEGEWEEKRLGKIAKFSRGKGIAKKDIIEGGKNECIRYGELYTIYNEVIDSIASKTDVSLKNSVVSDKNDVIIPSSGETQLDIATASCVLKGGVILGGDLNIIKSKLNGVFLAYLLNNSKKISIAKLAQGNSVVHLYNKELSTLNISFPIPEEQQKIASFLTSIDTRLQHLEKKKTLLEEYKRGVMQKIFSQEIRFKPALSGVEVDDDGKEFGEWEEKRLGEMLDYEQPTKFIVKSTEYDDSFPTPVLTAGKSFVLGYTDETDNIYTDFPVIIFDDFTMATQFVDFPFKVKSSAMKILKPCNDNFNIKFLFESIQMIKYPKGNEHKRFWISDYSKIKIGIPCLEEQTKIAHFLSALDRKIAAMDGQIEKTKEWKKGLLQRMFV